MREYLLRRLLIALPVLLAVSIIIFLIMHVAPGDAARMMLSGSTGESVADEATVAKLRAQLGLDRPYPEQYADFMLGLVRFDPGTSLWSGLPVTQELAERAPITLELAVLAALISWLIAIPTGVLSAVRQDTWVDYVFRVVSVAGLAVPVFWLGTLVVLAMSTWFRWTPPLGYAGLVTDPGRNFQQFIWPALVLGYSGSAVLSRMTRSAMLEVLREDYVQTARSKGLRERLVVGRHALKNALLPVVTLSAIQLGNLLGGAVISESIFALPGIGRFLVDGIFHRDYPVVQTIVVLLAVVFVLLNLLVDMLYAWLDPRIRYA
jgi:peptide/nickel transport system permease protein